MTDQFYTKAEVDKLLTESEDRAVEKALRTLPFIVNNLVANAASIQKTRENFYKDNPQLEKHKDLVARVMEEVEHRNPAASVQEVADKTATEAKRRLESGEFNLTRGPKPTQGGLVEGLEDILEKL